MIRLALFGFLLGGACTGELHEIDDAGAAPLTFAPTIESDLDTLGCSASGGGLCHGGGTAPMHLVMGASDSVSLMLNYAQVKPRASSGATSLLLTKPTMGTGVSHAGGQPFASTSDATYQRWLAWITAGDPFGAVTASDGGAPHDLAAHLDAAASDDAGDM